MSILDNLLNRNPTADWRRDSSLALVLDLDEESFCGIRLGERADRLQKLGPASDAAAARAGRYEYAPHGFLCQAEQGRFVEVELAFTPDRGTGRYEGLVKRGGRAQPFSPGASEQDVIALLGEPADRSDEPAGEYLPATSMLNWRLLRTDCSAHFEDARLTEFWLGTKL